MKFVNVGKKLSLLAVALSLGVQLSMTAGALSQPIRRGAAATWQTAERIGPSVTRVPKRSQTTWTPASVAATQRVQQQMPRYLGGGLTSAARTYSSFARPMGATGQARQFSSQSGRLTAVATREEIEQLLRDSLKSYEDIKARREDKDYPKHIVIQRVAIDGLDLSDIKVPAGFSLVIQQSHLTNVTFNGALLGDCFLLHNTLENVSFANSELPRAVFQGNDFNNVDFTNANLGNAKFTRNKGEAVFDQAVAVGAVFMENDLTNMRATGTNFTKAYFGRAYTEEQGSYRVYPTRKYDNKKNNNLTGGDFSRANLTDADLSYANLTNAIFQDANLSGASLNNSIVDGANFDGANLSGVHTFVGQYLPSKANPWLDKLSAKQRAQFNKYEEQAKQKDAVNRARIRQQFEEKEAQRKQKQSWLGAFTERFAPAPEPASQISELDAYLLLGVKPGANRDEIVKAYLAFKFKFDPEGTWGPGDYVKSEQDELLQRAWLAKELLTDIKPQ